MSIRCREAGRHGHADVLIEDLAGSCAAECHYSEAASHMVQLAHDAFAAVSAPTLSFPACGQRGRQSGLFGMQLSMCMASKPDIEAIHGI